MRILELKIIPVVRSDFNLSTVWQQKRGNYRTFEQLRLNQVLVRWIHFDRVVGNLLEILLIYL